MADDLKDFVVTNKTSFMQRILDLVRNGYTSYTTGQISIEKVKFFSSKMDHHYSLSESKSQKYRKSKDGKAKFALIFLDTKHHSIEQGKVFFILLKTDGEMPANVTNERWVNVKEHKITLTNYELVRLTSKGKAKPVWTWRYTMEQFKALNDAIVNAVRRKADKDISDMYASLKLTPGFAGARTQVSKLYTTLENEFKRHRKGEKPPPRPLIPYVRRLASIGRKSSELGNKKPVRRNRLKKGTNTPPKRKRKNKPK